MMKARDSFASGSPERVADAPETPGWLHLGVRGLAESLVQPEKYFAAPLPAAVVLIPFAFAAAVRASLSGLEMRFATAAIAATVPPEVAARTDWASDPVLRGMSGASLVGGLLAAPVYAVLFSSVLFLACCARGHLIDFRKVFIPTAFATLAFALERAFIVLLLFVRGVGSIRGPADLEPWIGLGLLFAGPELLRRALDAVNVFELLGLLVVTVGIFRVSTLSRRESAICTCGTWGALQAASLVFRLAVSQIA